MSYDVQYESSFSVVGIAVRTLNSRADEIGELWKRFLEGGLAEQIASRADDSIYGVYSDYESDHTGGFKVTIGCAVPEIAPVPVGMSKQTVSAGRYAVFPVSGEIPESIGRAWSSVWNAPLDRMYHSDFERYLKDGAVTVNVGVR